MNTNPAELIQLPEAILTIKEYLLHLQNNICLMLEEEDGAAKFIEDKWEHHQGGGGLTRVLANGKVIEKAGVNFSHVSGLSLPQAALEKRPKWQDAQFQALGVSVVIHPLNPYAPTSHMNVRFIAVEKPDESPYWWFGGGFDLTPYYGFTEDCIHWHQTAKNACQPFGEEVYARFKKCCDDYFYLKHRQEARGIGGIFFDDLNSWGFEKTFKFMQQTGNHFIKAYQPILSRRKNHSYGEDERNFQLYRRGRYVEFNLLYDRGTLFGLQSAGRTESILMSLPPLAAWHYDPRYPENSPEASLKNNFLVARDWV